MGKYPHRCCNPKGQCVYCHVKPAQLPDKGFCASCEEKRVFDRPGDFYEKCDFCDRYHVNAVPQPRSWDDYN